ncbi:MAG: low molecular weight phosphotyrosine protein phosphatase [Bifidobacteriaceae bacterium]|nr:low molecular weight phosphotyrosine protein phosphatase [Bifidobacteriaceae bacterium]
MNRREPPAPLKLITVCTGNICRSPMAQAVLAARFAAERLDVSVDSAGVSSEEAGNPVDRRAARVLAAHGYPVPRHAAKLISDRDLAGSDLVLPMTFAHYRALRRQAAAAGADPEIRMFREFDPAADASAGSTPAAGEASRPSARLDIVDPWYGGPADYERSLAEIERAVPGILAWARRACADGGR